MYSTETKNYGQLTDSVFVQDEGIGFDFSDQSPVTFVQFNGLGGADAASVAKTLIFWKRYLFKKLGQHVNVVTVRDGAREFGAYSANYLGIPGICNSTFELANLLNEKLYLRNGTTRRVAVFADCGGTIPAILTSSVVPYHSLNLTTPYLTILGSEQEFDSSQYSTWISRKHSIWIHDEVSHMKPWFNTMEYLAAFVQNPGAQLNMHWATNIIGTDLLFRNTAGVLQGKPNVSIIDHEVPPDIEGHRLLHHLISSREYLQYVSTEVHAQFAALGIDTKVTGL